jgi:hypothetical protein
VRAFFRRWEVEGLTGLTDRQLGYAIKTGLLSPGRVGSRAAGFRFSWRDLFEAQIIAEVRKTVSLQVMRDFFRPLCEWLNTFDVGVLQARTLVIMVHPDGPADTFLVEGPDHANFVGASPPNTKRPQRRRTRITVQFRSLAQTVLERDEKQCKLVTRGEVA